MVVAGLSRVQGEATEKLGEVYQVPDKKTPQLRGAKTPTRELVIL